MKTINFGIIGCGMIAQIHAKAIAAAEGAALLGVADARFERAKSFADMHGVRAYETVEEMLADRAIDAVCVCTPSGFHAEAAIRAAEAGKHVLIEKPLAVTNEDCDRIIRAVEQAGVTAGVITQYRFSGAVRRLKELIDGGKLGKIISAELTMKYNRPQEYYAGSSWRGTRKLDGGALMNQGIHGVDALLYLLGGADSVCGYARTLTHKIEAADTVCAVASFQSGALALLCCTTSVYRGYPRSLVISGTRGTVSLKGDALESADIEGVTGVEETPPSVSGTGHADAADIDISGHIFQISDFVRAIPSRSAPVITLREAKKDVVFINAVYESSETGKRINLAEKPQAI